MADETGSVTQEKLLYLTQIRYLEEQLERYQLTCEELETQNEELRSEYNILKIKKTERTEHLEELVCVKEKKMDELLEELKNLPLMGEQYREALQLLYNQQEIIDDLESRHLELAATLKSKEEQLVVLKLELSTQRSKRKQIDDKSAEHEASIHNHRRATESDMEMFNKNLQNQTKVLVKVKASKILTKDRTIAKHQMALVPVLLEIRSMLPVGMDDLQHRMEDLETSRSDLVKETDTLIQQISVLKKQVDQDKQTVQELTMKQDEYLNTLRCRQEEAEALRERYVRLSEEHCEDVPDKVNLEVEQQELMVRRRQLEDVKQDAAIIIRHTQLDPEKPSDTQWKIQRLVEILQSTALPRPVDIQQHR